LISQSRDSERIGFSRATALRGVVPLAACATLAFGCSTAPESTPRDGTGGPALTGGTGSGASPSTGGTTAAGGAGAQGNAGGTGGLAAGAGAGGSAGTVTGGTAGSAPVVNPPPFEPAPGKLRRLTRTQFRNAVRDVFGVEVDVSELDADNYTGNFATIGAASVVTSERGVEQYHTAIGNAVDQVFADPSRRTQFLGCEPSAGNDACTRGFIESMGKRAWRRPLDTVEIERVVAVATNAATVLEDPVEGTRFATVLLFTSPNFLYRPELGEPNELGALRFTGYETASRLSFLIWNSLPDQALLDDAANGVLATASGIRAVAERMLDTPAGREAIGAFADEYMRLERIATQAKQQTLYPEYGPELQAAMARDMRGAWEAAAFDDRTSALELFSTTKVVVNRELALLYGLDATGLDSTTFQVRSLPADGPRLGLLGKAGFLSQFANQKEGSPTLRGKFISEAFLCIPIEPPPGDVDIVLEDPPDDAPLTKRQRLDAHRSIPVCAGCHAMMDPMGLPLENFDAIGRYRTTDRGLPIDPSGDFELVPVADARELGLVAAQSQTVANCMARKYHSYAVGHEERPVDGSVVNDVALSFQTSGYKLRDLILSVVAHDGFSVVAPQP
jgi:hypothetical protein